MPHVVVGVRPVLLQDVVGAAVQLTHSPVLAKAFAHEQKIGRLFKSSLGHKVVLRDEKLEQPPQTVGVRFVAQAGEAKVPVGLGFRCYVVENLQAKNIKCNFSIKSFK